MKRIAAAAFLVLTLTACGPTPRERDNETHKRLIRMEQKLDVLITNYTIVVMEHCMAYESDDIKGCLEHYGVTP